jgi:hypothetical protein
VTTANFAPLAASERPALSHSNHWRATENDPVPQMR